MTPVTNEIIQGMPPRLRPQRALLSSHSRPQFGFMGKEAVSMLVTDTTSVLIPKLLVTRTEINAVEDIFLECGENVPFYMAVPFATRTFLSRKFGNLGLDAKTLQALAPKTLEKIDKNLTAEQTVLGSSMKNLLRRAEQAGVEVPAKLVANKAGMILGALALAGATEYMIQHAKNVYTAKKYNAKSFTQVAGLQGRSQENGFEDPVVKAKRRTWQTGAAALGLLGASFALPKLILRSGGLQKAAQTVLKQFDFGHNGLFDMSKPLLFVLALTGFASYLDASRDKLEVKENLTRVPIIIGFYMAGKEALCNALGAWLERSKVQLHGAEKAIKDIVPFLDKKLLFNDSFLDFNIVKSTERLGEELSRVKDLPAPIRDFIMRKHQGITLGARLFTILIMGVLFNKLLYQATEARHKSAAPQPLQRPQVTLRVGGRFSAMQHV